MLFYGRLLNMSKQEILNTRYGEMLDMINCQAIYNGAEPKKSNKSMSFLEIMSLE